MGSLKPIVRKTVWGLVLIAGGLLILLSNHGLLGISFSFRQDWPAIFILIGLWKLLNSIG